MEIYYEEIYNDKSIDMLSKQTFSAPLTKDNAKDIYSKDETLAIRFFTYGDAGEKIYLTNWYYFGTKDLVSNIKNEEYKHTLENDGFTEVCINDYLGKCIPIHEDDIIINNIDEALKGLKHGLREYKSANSRKR